MVSFWDTTVARHRRSIEIGALGSLAGLFAILSIWDPQGIDFFAVFFFLLGSLLIDRRDIENAGWMGRRPFVFACAIVIIAMSFLSGACSANGFRSQIGTGVYIAAAAPALFLVTSKARFQLIGRQGISRLILASLFIGFVPAALYVLVFVGGATHEEYFYLFGQPAMNIAAVFMSCIMAILLLNLVDAHRWIRIFGYVVVLVIFFLGLKTGSRTFLVSSSIVLVGYFLVIRREHALRRELYAIVAAIALIGVFSAALFRSSVARLWQYMSIDVSDGRLGSWSDAIELFRRYPVCGIGPHTFYNEALNPLYIERIQHGIQFTPNYTAHNIYLNTLAEGGLILGVLLLALVLAAAYGCVSLLKAEHNNRFGQIAATLLGIFILVGFFENMIVRPVMFPLAIFLGLGMNPSLRAIGFTRQGPSG